MHVFVCVMCAGLCSACVCVFLSVLPFLLRHLWGLVWICLDAPPRLALLTAIRFNILLAFVAVSSHSGTHCICNTHAHVTAKWSDHCACTIRFTYDYVHSGTHNICIANVALTTVRALVD